MFGKFLKKFMYNTLVWSLGSMILGIPFIAYQTIITYPLSSIPILFIFLMIVAYITTQEFIDEANKQVNNIKNEMLSLQKVTDQAKFDENLLKQTLIEKNQGFPTLISLIDNYEQLRDEQLSNYLRTKSHPAYTAAETVKEESKKRRAAEKLQRNTASLIEYYENIAPFLLDFKNEIIDENTSDIGFKEYSEEEKQDPVTSFLTKEEYRKLPSAERNQMALDRYWKRHKSKWEIGRIYERYIGSIYEIEGYEVEYHGIFKGYEDLGRDLICRKGNKIVIIQCKYWSHFKTIFEKHIFQFFGTVFQYKDIYKSKDVKGIFYTTTRLSDLAKRFASELGIELKEEFSFYDKYPCIKCNVNDVTHEKIYHLPFDQQYDTIKIEPKKGELYTDSVEKAEKLGFRRAYRWHSTS